MKLPCKLTVFSGLLLPALGLLVSGCTSTGDRSPQDTSAETAKPSVLPPYKGGGYYKDDGPGANPPPNLHAVPDAVPREEPLHRFANDAYRVKGVRYVPDLSGEPYKAEGLASWYGRKFHGKPTSSGEPYDMYGMTAAHKTLPIPSYARVTNLDNGRSVVVRINDRGPFHEDRIIDLSYTAAYKLDLLKGVSMVEVQRMLPEAGDAPTSFAAQAGEDTGAGALTLAADTNAASQAPETGTQPELPATAASPANSLPPGGAVYLQFGAYANPETADAQMKRLVQKLGPHVPGVVRQESGGLVKIQAGPYASPAEADLAAVRLHEICGIKPYRLPGRAAEQAAPAPARENATAPHPDRNAPAHWLQLAAYANAESAERLVARLKDHPDLPGIEKLEVGGLVKVQAGPYASAELASQAAIRLAADLGHKPYRLLR